MMNACNCRVVALFAALGLCGCSGWQSSLDDHGLQAGEIKQLFLIFLAVSTCVWVAVMAVLTWSLLKHKASRADPLAVDAAAERRAGRIIFVFGVGTAAIVLTLSFLSYLAQTSVLAKDRDALRIRIYGHQWWWEVQYQGQTPDQTFTTANEIYVPVGQPVEAELETRDVIHSFWVPSLTGKMDLINGQQNAIQFTAKSSGVYRGQCAEFCGLQHANMAFEVIALASKDFEAWRAKQAGPAQQSNDPTIRSGEALFRGRGCALCHTIRGTPAGGQLGPDLTHVGSRRTIAAGTLPMTPGNLAAWIADPQHVKPGNLMPSMSLDAASLTQIVQYLGSLK